MLRYSPTYRRNIRQFHVHEFERTELAELFRSKGFRIEYFRYYNFFGTLEWFLISFWGGRMNAQGQPDRDIFLRRLLYKIRDTKMLGVHPWAAVEIVGRKFLPKGMLFRLKRSDKTEETHVQSVS